MEKEIMVGTVATRFRATAAVPRLYRIKFKRDILRDMAALQKAYVHDEDGDRVDVDKLDLEAIENIAYIMAKHADPQGVPSDPDEWLTQFEGFSLYRAAGEIISLWTDNMQGSVSPKKL